MSRDGTQSRSGGRASPDARGRNSRGTASNRTPDLRGQTGNWCSGCVDGRGTGTRGLCGRTGNWYSGCVDGEELVLRICEDRRETGARDVWTDGETGTRGLWTERELVLMVCGWRGNWYSGSVDRRGTGTQGLWTDGELVLRVCGPTGNWYSGCVD